MGKTNNNGASPEFTTKSGVVLKLKPIKGLILERFQIDYQKAYPPPKPPQELLSNGDWWSNVRDEDYKDALAQWKGRQSGATIDFVFSLGITSTPPKGWATDYPFMEHTTPKLVWLAETLEDEELEELSEAIVSIANPTAKAIEEAEKN